MRMHGPLSMLQIISWISKDILNWLEHAMRSQRAHFKLKEFRIDKIEKGSRSSVEKKKRETKLTINSEIITAKSDCESESLIYSDDDAEKPLRYRAHDGLYAIAYEVT